MADFRGEVPISFEHRGKKYNCILKHVSGAGNHYMFFLSENGYHLGQLFLTDDGWRFYSNSNPELDELGEWFGEYVTLWFE